MLKVFFNLSPKLNQSLEKIVNLRKEVLSIPLSPSEELKFRWEMLINRIYLSLSLEGKPLTKKGITKVFLNPLRKRFSNGEIEAIRYKKAFDLLYWNWLVSPEVITTKTVSALRDIACAKSSRFNFDEIDLDQSLKYLQQTEENPIIKAGIVYILILTLHPSVFENERLARLATYLFLYKYGYDIRGLLVLEDSWQSDLQGFKNTVEQVIKTGNFTLWLEYFGESVFLNLEKLLILLSNRTNKEFSLPKKFFQLTQRQREIISLLDQPEVNITNKQVQKIFKISQITASRELSKLTHLGLIFSRGKGRSVSYSKI